MDEKKALRREIRRRAALLSPEERRAADEAMLQAVSALPEFRDSRRILFYWSVKTEPDTHRLIDLARARGKDVLLPFCLGDGVMEARLLPPGAETVPGLLNIPTAPEGALCVPPTDVELVIVPGLCFDRRGYRLGQGGGYYDRYLAVCPGFSLGLCYGSLLADRVPREAWDRPVQCLVTERETLRFF